MTLKPLKRSRGSGGAGKVAAPFLEFQVFDCKIFRFSTEDSINGKKNYSQCNFNTMLMHLCAGREEKGEGSASANKARKK